MTITKKVSKILLFSFGLIEILLNCKTVNAATNADSSTEVVANYELSSIPADTLKDLNFPLTKVGLYLENSIV